MKIRNTIARSKGTIIKFDETVYEFTDANNHTVEVTDAEHIARFMAVVGMEKVQEEKPTTPLKPKRKRRTKAEMEAARAAEAVRKEQSGE